MSLAWKKIFVAIGVAFLCLSTALAQDPRQDDVTVEVTGSGASPLDARMDAIRQALQQALPQIVFADREISNDKLIRDQVLSSVNGHAKSAKLLEQKVANGFIQARYLVTISAQEIENFLNFRNRNEGSISADIDGEGLYGEVQREKEAREFREAYIRRAIAPFPSQVIQAKVIGIRPGDDLDNMDLTIEYQFDQKWISAFKDALKQVECQRHISIHSRLNWQLIRSKGCDAPVCFGPVRRLVGISRNPRETGWSDCVYPGRGTGGYGNLSSTGIKAINLLLNYDGQEYGRAELFLIGVLKNAKGLKIGQEFCLSQQWPVKMMSSNTGSNDKTRSVIFDQKIYGSNYLIDLKKIGITQIDHIANLELTPIVRRLDKSWLDITLAPVAQDFCKIKINPRYINLAESKS